MVVVKRLIVTWEMQVGIVGSQKRTKGVCGEFEGTDENLKTYIEDKGPTSGYVLSRGS